MQIQINITPKTGQPVWLSSCHINHPNKHDRLNINIKIDREINFFIIILFYKNF